MEIIRNVYNAAVIFGTVVYTVCIARDANIHDFTICFTPDSGHV